jgi:spermidine synthase
MSGVSTTPPSPLPAWAAALLTFLAAASVLVLEIAAGRLLAPFVGVSLTTYTGIIGVILAGIALGAWLGGRAADRYGPERLIGATIAAGGVAAIASIPIIDAVGTLGLGSEFGGIVLLAGAGFVLPATILSAVGPMIVRASLTDLRSSGSLVGRLSAIGTAGAISGTFLTGFVLLGLVPTRPLIVGVGALLIGLGIVTALALGRARSAVLLALVGLLAGTGLVAASAPSPCLRESAYYCVVVRPDPGASDGRTLVLDGVRHSYVDLGDPSVLGFRYVRWIVDASAPLIEALGGNVDIAYVGGGGFTLPRYLESAYPASRHTVLELDPMVLATARSELGFAPTSRTTVIVGDARLSARGLPTDAYDLVIGDAFGSLSVPWHLTTREFLAEIDRLMRPSGLYVMNIIDNERLRFAKAEVATLRSVFEHVVVIAGGSPLGSSAGGNLVLLASHEPIDAEVVLERIRARDDRAAALLSLPSDLEAFTAGASILTDDFAPVDQLLAR